MAKIFVNFAGAEYHEAVFFAPKKFQKIKCKNMSKKDILKYHRDLNVWV